MLSDAAGGTAVNAGNVAFPPLLNSREVNFATRVGSIGWLNRSMIDVLVSTCVVPTPGDVHTITGLGVSNDQENSAVSEFPFFDFVPAGIFTVKCVEYGRS